MTKKQKVFIVFTSAIFILITGLIIFDNFFYSKGIIPKRNYKNTKEIEKQFIKLLEEHGEKIELEKMDTADWKTYEDIERGFSFQYPANWYISSIDSTAEKKSIFSYTAQKGNEETYKHMGFPLNTSNLSFLCLTSEEKGEENNFILSNNPYKKFELNWSKKKCSIVFYDNITSLREEKKSPIEMWLDDCDSFIWNEDKTKPIGRVACDYIKDYNIYI